MWVETSGVIGQPELLIGNASILTEHVKTNDHWIMLNDQAVKIVLNRGPLLKRQRRYQVPAPVSWYSVDPALRTFQSYREGSLRLSSC